MLNSLANVQYTYLLLFVIVKLNRMYQLENIQRCAINTCIL